MKKINNKYRNNNYSNQIYSLNYKFDSNSPAGKFNGTALDLIKKYNELAKDALSNNDHIAAEVFRQYAEHYRKIVTDINEKKMQRNNLQRENEREEESAGEAPAGNDNTAAEENKTAETFVAETVETPVKKEFKVIEITEAAPQLSENKEESAQPKKRVYRRKTMTASVM